MTKILITGINGFIGSNCKKYFESKGYEVFGIDVAGAVKNNILIGEVDLENLCSMNQSFDIILHLAGTSTVTSAQTAPELEFTKTVCSAKHILEYIKKHNPNSKLIYSSSAAVYGNCADYEFIPENSILKPISIYGEHKLVVEKMIKNGNTEWGLNANIIRFFSIYGEGLKKQLLWDFSKRVKENFNEKTITCFGTGNELRDFIHISDAIKIIDMLINVKNNYCVVNAGCGIKTSVNEVINLICKQFNWQGELVYDNIERKGNPTSIVANTEKIKNMGFVPEIKIEDGIKRYVRWFEKNY